MKGGLRFAICISLLLIFSLYLLEAHLQDICNQYRAGAYLAEWLNRNEATQKPIPIYGTPGDKVIVMAKLAEEHTEWVQEELPEYVSLCPCAIVPLFSHSLIYGCCVRANEPALIYLPQ